MTASDVRAALARVEARITAAAAQTGRDPGSILLLGATKGVEPADIDAAAAAGLRAVGENRVQELERKRPIVGAGLRWDFIGSLQRNKVRKVVGEVSLIHGVDDGGLIRAIGAAAVERGIEQDILIEVNTSGEATKHGCSPSDLGGLARQAAETSGVRLRGLMTIAAPDPEYARAGFVLLRRLAGEIAPHIDGSPELSMGMSGDLEAAVQEGATIVRVGSAIFRAHRT